MYSMLTAVLLFFQIIDCRHIWNGSPLEEKVIITVKIEKVEEDGSVTRHSKQQNAYCSKSTYYVDLKNPIKKALFLWDEPIEVFLTDALLKVPHEHELSSFNVGAQTDGFSYPLNYLSVQYARNVLFNEAPATKKALLSLEKNYIIMADYNESIKRTILFLKKIDYKGFIGVLYTEEEQLEELIEFSYYLVGGPVVLGIFNNVDLDCYKALLADGKNSRTIKQHVPNIYIEISPGMHYHEPLAPVTILILICFLTIIIGIMYLFISRHTVEDTAPKTVAMPDLHLIPSMPYNSIPSADSILGKECIICFEEFTPETFCRILPCRHIYHMECVDAWLRSYSNRCPYCQSVVK
ncbi:hypothetical protein NEAUS06_0964 [Nematocida ausubeli]|nr:hypothetical protein NEAUS06_0964 [Nematocida ausubeli]